MPITAVLCVSAVGGLLLDQLSKAIVSRRLPAGRVCEVLPYCRLHRVGNRRGSLLGLSWRAAGLVWLAALVCTGISSTQGVPAGAAAAAGLGLALGGAAGNLVDRTVRGEVLDFIAIGRWRPFNVADVALVIGAITVPWSML
jgi:signal peptidase II